MLNFVILCLTKKEKKSFNFLRYVLQKDRCGKKAFNNFRIDAKFCYRGRKHFFFNKNKTKYKYISFFYIFEIA